VSLYYPIPQPTIAANILLRRERRLPVPGEVLVRAGQRVEPSELIAQGTLPSEPVQVNIAADLDLSPAAAAKRLRVSVGQQVEQGTILAQRGGIGSRASRSPVIGTFSGYDPTTGIGLITTPAEPVSVQAHIKGIVTDLIPYYGAIVETPATLIRGIFGVGGEQHGVLKVIVTGNDEPVTTDIVDARVAYAIVLGGSEVTADALRRMIELGARGLITGSIRSSELAGFLGYNTELRALRTSMRLAPDKAQDDGYERGVLGAWRLGASSASSNGWDFPPPNPGIPSPVPPDFVLIVTEGFGSVPMCPRTFELLAAHDGQEIAIDGTTRLRWGLARPEIIIPLARTTPVRFLDESGPRLAVGTNVRLLSPDYLGQVAQVTGLPVGPRATGSGVIAPVADVVLPTGQRLRVPTVNLEVLE
jgi:murein DD-endopeptidase MepM/ murein hydrolase activator NlpD